jgi:histone arginine demethylase JMJD6
MPERLAYQVAKGLDVILKGEDDEAVNYFVDILPRIKAKWGSQYTPIEFTQMPGETVYVPGGWWHSVINIDDTVAITQVCYSSSMNGTSSNRMITRVFVR